MGYTPHILVVGGGVTGTGLARDLAMRGLEVTLVERGRLTSGATGRTQGLLDSGARFAVSDPETAADCHAESATLRDVASHCVTDTGGLVVSLSDDDPEYFERTESACEEAGIDAEELSGSDAREREPALGEAVERALLVPDAAVDPFRLTVANAKSARNYGAEVKTHAPVTDVRYERGAVAGVEIAGENGTTAIDADYVVNATGPWADEVAAMAGFDLSLRHVRGAMVVLNDRPTERVVTRCRPGDEGDIVVPYDGKTLVGTTAETVEDPDSISETREEVDRLVEEAAAVVPSLRETRSIRSFGTVRSGYDREGTGSHECVILDHEARDDTWGMSTVVGGTVTTSRLVAERVADHVCAKFGIDRPCLTAEEALPGSESEAVVDDAGGQFGLSSPVVEASRERLGSQTGEVLETTGPNPVLCECELVTREEVQAAMRDGTGERTDLNEVRIRTRAGMGECQGGRCCHLLASELYPLSDVAEMDRALDDLYDERWSGQRHALWGDQLAEAMRTYELHAATLNRPDEDQADVDLSAFDSGAAWERGDVGTASGGQQ
ncbi:MULTISPECIES: anaerobic glycerol-3-phosphate dehydrogenase subunit GlpA [Salinibaculum]|uniref:anaerobic glycerol-3-phosphate dehydrogenase subunit GlpA n=1 Tax=Salinibaculum TaxID=2732368 RepID=UPI0030D2FBEE